MFHSFVYIVGGVKDKRMVHLFVAEGRKKSTRENWQMEGVLPVERSAERKMGTG